MTSRLRSQIVLNVVDDATRECRRVGPRHLDFRPACRTRTNDANRLPGQAGMIVSMAVRLLQSNATFDHMFTD